MLQNARVRVFVVSELFKGNSDGGKGGEEGRKIVFNFLILLKLLILVKI